jgi:hypothetical protein
MHIQCGLVFIGIGSWRCLLVVVLISYVKTCNLNLDMIMHAIYCYCSSVSHTTIRRFSQHHCMRLACVNELDAGTHVCIAESVSAFHICLPAYCSVSCRSND